MKKITVLLADNHAAFREGLRCLLRGTEDIDVIGEVENDDRAVGEARSLRLAVVLMDVAMPKLNGVEAARRIAMQAPAAKVLMLFTSSDARPVQEAVAARAAGYLRKESASQRVLEAIREVCDQNPVFSPPGASELTSRPQKNALRRRAKGARALTGRQLEVLQWIAEGHTSKEIARLLRLSIKTVEKHRQAVMTKLDIHEIASLTRYAISRGIVESNLTAPQRAQAH